MHLSTHGSYAYSPKEAQDLTPEMFLRASQALPRFRGRSSVYTWLYRIAMNTCIDHVRKARTRFDLKQIRVEDSTPLDETLNQEIGERIREAIEMLPPKQRQVFVLRYRRGLALQEIADAVGRRLGTVKRQLFDATRKMREGLSAYAGPQTRWHDFPAD